VSARSRLRLIAAWARRRVWLALLVGAVGLLLWVRLWRPVPAEAVRVERGLVVHEAFGRGTVESQREAAVGFDLVGRLSEVLVDEGARVTLGQELARLETDQAQADLRTAQTGIGAARAALARFAADEDRARALLTGAEREATKAEALVAAGVVPGQQGDDARDRLRVARADLDRVLAQRAEATRGIDVARGGAEQRRVAMVRASLLAPFDGLVTRRLREPGDTVTVGSTVLRLVDTEQVVRARPSTRPCWRCSRTISPRRSSSPARRRRSRAGCRGSRGRPTARPTSSWSRSRRPASSGAWRSASAPTSASSSRGATTCCASRCA
jgi:multidrug efflux pump subunit AcrA (membrane-fusion protein)